MMSQILGGTILIGLTYIVLDLIIGFVSDFLNPKQPSLKGRHVMVTGGSKGIGKEVAKEFVKIGANVSILARNLAELANAREEILHCVCPDNEERQKVVAIGVDVTANHDTVAHSVQQAIQSLGPVYILVNCAGFSLPQTFENSSIEDERRQMDVNYFGSTSVTRAVLPGMKQNGEGGHIVFIASQAALVGIFGMSSYCASKFALRGFAESLAMELAAFDIHVTLNCPPDTDTPGFVEENLSKPEETQLICSSAGLFQPKVIARQLLKDTLQKKFLSTSGLDGWLATTLSSGLVNCSFGEMIKQVLLMGPMRLVSWVIVKQFYNTIIKCHTKRCNKNKKSY